LVGRVGVDKSDRIRFGRLKAARRVKTRDGLHQPTTWANRRFADQMYLTELNQSKLVGRVGVEPTTLGLRAATLPFCVNLRIFEIVL